MRAIRTHARTRSAACIRAGELCLANSARSTTLSLQGSSARGCGRHRDRRPPPHTHPHARIHAPPPHFCVLHNFLRCLPVLFALALPTTHPNTHQLRHRGVCNPALGAPRALSLRAARSARTTPRAACSPRSGPGSALKQDNASAARRDPPLRCPRCPPTRWHLRTRLQDPWSLRQR